MKRIIAIIIVLCATACSWAQTETVRIHFRVNSDSIICDSSYHHFVNDMLPKATETKHIIVSGSASPEGRQERNLELSKMRAHKIADMLPYAEIRINGEDYNTLDSLIRCSNIKNKDEIRRIIRTMPQKAKTMKELRQFFPELRATEVTFVYPQNVYSLSVPEALEDTKAVESVTVRTDTVVIHDTLYIERERKPFVRLKTNLLLDAIPYSQFGFSMMPNVQAEWLTYFHNTSVELEYIFPWWKSDATHKYFQIISGTLGIRKYLRDDYTGWSFGIFGTTGYYDLCASENKGWQGEHWSVGATVAYTLHTSKSLKWEFYCRIGYLKTRYDKYVAGRPYLGKYYYDYYGEPSDYKFRNHTSRYFGPVMIGINLSLDTLWR